MKQFYVVLLLCVYFFVSCQKQEVATIPKEILSISLAGVQIISQTYDASTHTYTLVVPYQTNLTSITPTISISAGVSMVPLSAVAQNFTKPVYYTLTGSDGSKVVYTLVLQSQSQPTPKITTLSKSTLEAGESLLVQGENFGRFGLDISVSVLDSNQKETKVNSQELDSTRIAVSLPFDLKPQSYQVVVYVKQARAVSTQKLLVRYPSPQVLAQSKNNVVQGDSLTLTGNYIQSPYQYEVSFQNQQNNYRLKADVVSGLALKGGSLRVLVEKQVVEGSYQLFIKNVTEGKVSQDSTFQVRINDNSKPYIKSIENYQNSYVAGSTLVCKTVNFSTLPVRFYQVQLIGKQGSSIQNGLYDAKAQTLSFDLPTTILSGKYNLSFTLLDTNGKVLYTFSIDTLIEIH